MEEVEERIVAVPPKENIKNSAFIGTKISTKNTIASLVIPIFVSTTISYINVNNFEED